MAGTVLVEQQKKSVVSIIASVAAIGGVVASFTGHPYWGLFIGLGAIVLSALGFAMAASPRVSGGLLSIAAIALSIIGLGLSVLVAIGVIIF